MGSVAVSLARGLSLRLAHLQATITTAVLDTAAYPAGQSGCKLAAGMTACVSDASLQAEIGRLIDAGQLPRPAAPGSGTTPIFFVE